MRETLRRLTTPDALATLRRFPVTILAAAMITGRAALWTDRFPHGADDEAWLFGWAVALVAAVAITLFAESLGGRRPVLPQLLALALGAAAWAGYGGPQVSALSCMLPLGVFVLLAPAPGRDEQGLWSFDARIVVLLVFALIAASVATLGVLAIKSAAQYLFDLTLDDRWDQRIFTIGYGFVFPVYWCALLPTRDQEPLQPSDLLFKAAVALGAVLALVVGVLAGLLHVYAARIAVDGALPKNQVGWIVGDAAFQVTAATIRLVKNGVAATQINGYALLPPR